MVQTRSKFKKGEHETGDAVLHRGSPKKRENTQAKPSANKDGKHNSKRTEDRPVQIKLSWEEIRQCYSYYIGAEVLDWWENLLVYVVLIGCLTLVGYGAYKQLHSLYSYLCPSTLISTAPS